MAIMRFLKSFGSGGGGDGWWRRPRRTSNRSLLGTKSPGAGLGLAAGEGLAGACGSGSWPPAVTGTASARRAATISAFISFRNGTIAPEKLMLASGGDGEILRAAGLPDLARAVLRRAGHDRGRTALRPE